MLTCDKLGVVNDPTDRQPPKGRGPRHAVFCAACFARELARQSPPAASAASEPQQQQQTERTEMPVVSIKNGKLVIELPLNEQPTPSASGKTLVVASTHGNIATTAVVNGKPVVIGVNAYIKP
jgi:hypothetical protein